jgi:hypothetical protein
MTAKFISWLLKKLHLSQQLEEIRLQNRIINSKLDYMIKNSNRRIRRKWMRVAGNPKSPFYVGDKV